MNDKELSEEVFYFEKIFFNTVPAASTIDRYIEANKIILQEDYRNILPIRKIVSDKGDIEALELAWRLKKRDNPLSKKIYIFFYIIEVRSDHYNYLISDKESLVRGKIELLIGVIRTAYKLIKGYYLLRKYDVI